MSKVKKTISGKTVWPKNLEIEKVDQTIATTYFPDMEKFNEKLIEFMVKRSQEKLDKEGKVSSSKSTKLHHIDTWAVPGAKLINERAQTFFRQMTGAESSVVDLSWGNVYRNGDYIMPHAHNRSTGSVVYVVSMGDIDDDPMSGKFCISDPRLPICRARGDALMSNNYMPDFKAGSMIVFPSSVVHMVTPYKGKNPRITLAWNINAKQLTARPEADSIGIPKHPDQR